MTFDNNKTITVADIGFKAEKGGGWLKNYNSNLKLFTVKHNYSEHA